MLFSDVDGFGIFNEVDVPAAITSDDELNVVDVISCFTWNHSSFNKISRQIPRTISLVINQSTKVFIFKNRNML